jgi:hypothetical protein
MLGTSSGNTARENLPPFSYKAAERIRVFVINFEFLRAKPANFLLEKAFPAPSAAPFFIAPVTTVFTTAFPVLVKRPPAPSIRPPLASSGLYFRSSGFRLHFTACGLDYGRYCFCLLI